MSRGGTCKNTSHVADCFLCGREANETSQPISPKCLRQATDDGSPLHGFCKREFEPGSDDGWLSFKAQLLASWVHRDLLYPLDDLPALPFILFVGDQFLVAKLLQFLKLRFLIETRC